MNELSWWKRICFVILLCAATAVASSAQTFTTLVSFNGTDGANPYYMSLVQGTDGNFYGTTSIGGANNYGTVFKVTSAGALTTLHSFNKTDGANPYAGLVQATNGNFYGTTNLGGANNDGTVFEVTSAGALTTLHSFGTPPLSLDGGWPFDRLIQATNGNFYGTTTGGGAHAVGDVFKITPGGTLTTLYSFCAQPNCTDGANPYAGLVQATNGNFYGTTVNGGANGIIGGTVFTITPGGTLTTLHNFNYNTDGSKPYARLVQATDGNFYGTTYQGGVTGAGTVFKITPGVTLTTLHSFNGTDGAGPFGLVQATDGNFYGTTYSAGANSYYGTIFSLSVGLGPFVKTLPTSGKVGAAVKILGTNLTGATSVSFNGTAAAFTIVSASEISTTVPAGATTGKVRVTTSGGTLLSNLAFRVTPVISSFSPTSGPVGTVVVITGQSLTGATSVTFGGVKATSFTVDSYTQITATVPTGAQTGKIGVTTAGGTATSVGTFTVN